MSAVTTRPVNFVAGRDYPSPVARVIGFDYYDGVTAGVLQTAGGAVYQFELVDETFNPDGANTRNFELIPRASDVFDRIVSLLAPHAEPRWPIWVPQWTFPTEAIQHGVDERIDQWLAPGVDATWRIECQDLTGTILDATPV